MADGGGLYLLITPSGGKLWRMDYRYNDKRKTLILKSYPEISLADARQRRDDARKLLANGTDPNEQKKSLKAQELEQAAIEVNTFEKVAREWHESRKSEWSENHSGRLLKRLENDVFAFIANKPIADIERTELVNLLQRVAIRTNQTAVRLQIAFRGVFRYAHNKGIISYNPAVEFRDVIPKVTVKHMAAPIEPKKAAELLKAMDCFTGSFVVMCALQLAPILFYQTWRVTFR